MDRQDMRIHYLTNEERAGLYALRRRGFRLVFSSDGDRVAARPGHHAAYETCAFDALLLLFLLLSDMTHAIGNLISIQWLWQGYTVCGTVCNVQGALKVLSDSGSSMYSLAIAVHTFFVIVLSWTPPTTFRIPAMVVGLSWMYRLVFYAAIVGTQQAGKPLFAPTPFWCWISAAYHHEREPAFYLWLWSSTGLSILLYVPMFLRIRGNLEVDPSRFWRISLRRTPTPIEVFGPTTRLADQSRKMLMYPVVYIVLSVPFSVMRWAANFRGTHTVDTPWYFLCISLHNCEGLANVLLLTMTRPSILGFSRGDSRGQGRAGTAEPRVVHEEQGMDSLEGRDTP
ncbi:hypothetical protein EXIGLDRAFT_769185 [Exidia glandulosa HHB12029]|uniref:Uncharacterized protein n=1 Tax=Exidia glandulosa HHB12029 TaxID=1314781 RepID=A0A165HMY0_EXIGL|nr:hypothetical protein EXIGLDRAFT_769185 [Exidia glandulosa HHB12029]